MIEQLRPADLPAWVAAHAQAGVLPLVLDVREPWALQTAQVKAQGFEVLAIPMRELPARLTELPANRPIACLCHHGVRSQHVAAFLLNNGVEQVLNIAGGIEAWSTELDTQVPHY
jgi:rhodanese-related sulfurtransferase